MAETPALYIGIDAGASKTVCLLGDSSEVLGRGIAGSGNPNVVGLEGHATAIRAAVDAAFADAGLAPAGVIRAWLGVAGSMRPETREAIRAGALDSLAAHEVFVSHDARLILPAAGLAAGVALVAGTGSAALGVAPDGTEATAGGWGYLFGDEGSGYELGRLALRAISQAADGRGPATTLTAAVLASLGMDEPAELLALLDPMRPASEIAGLGGLILEIANRGDAVATNLVDDTARALATLTYACADAAGLAAPVEVVAAGGLVQVGSPVLAALSAALAPPTFRVRRLDAEPASGALILARRPPAHGIPVFDALA
jgi:N-acetylglucosamine kinase-like BadF-type ATPase